ncbi:hypothetical protein V1639_11010 [Pseudarthrobacter sp. J75]|uniref:hypothetical protein n=1 Tax=unclassified Pseudarthrobacter TaxID=2647000 RepID=UPI002E81FF58|nr:MULTISPECIES: hypothetical protein [unclassified Pseudarthrobacter]MEE2522685.1 hypothetical protein [Pseudarthrobacter sp. J47]MEE2529546.1 hypothetical protein [Pseudarthrobacter sp. J75]
MNNNRKTAPDPLTTLPQGKPLRRNRLALCTGVLAAAYASAGIAWGLTGTPFPVGDADPYATSLLFGVPHGVVGWGLVVLAIAAAALAAAAGTRRSTASPSKALRAGVALMAGMMCLIALGLVGDARLLSVIGYIPVILAKASYDPQIQDGLHRLLDPSLMNIVGLAAGAALWVALAVRVDRAYRGACSRCGRNAATADGPFSAAAAARWGRAAVSVAVVVPLVYAITRIAWAFGIPVGLDPSIQDEMVAQGMDSSALGLGAMALAGAILTLGLVQKWGEVFPRWIPGLAGRRVPIRLAVIPATFVAMAVIPASVTMIRMASMPSGSMVPSFSASNWAPYGPAFLWPLWGIALAAATLAYYLRRRGECPDCHRNS